MSELLFRKVLNNEHLLENILDHLSEDFTKNLSVRLVNSSFNANFLRSIRLNYRRMKMECIGAPENLFFPNTIKDYIYINYRKVKKTVVPNYFRFLKNVAKVKVEEIIVKNISNAGRVFAEKFHDLVYNELIGLNRANVRKLIGLGELCSNWDCDDCFDMIHQCREYGPVPFDTLRRLTSVKMFDKLHVTDRTLKNFAVYCSFFAGCKEDSVVLLDSVIRPEISVDHLVLWINESQGFFKNGVKMRDLCYMPREVIDIMLKRWNVKSVTLNIVRSDDILLDVPFWIRRQYFSVVSLKDAPGMIKQSDLKINSVSVKLSQSHFCSNGLMFRTINYTQQRGYENMISNIRRMFPTDRISIKFSHFCNVIQQDETIRVMDNILRVAQLGGQTNLSIYCQFFTDSSTRCPKNPLQHAIYRRSMDPSICEQLAFKREQWINSRIHVKDTRNEFEIMFDFYVKDR